MTIPFTHMLFLAILLFVMGAACAMTRKNLFMILIGVEVMLNAAGIAFVAAAMRWLDMNGQVMALFVMTAAAAEIAVALALIVCIQRRTGSTDSDLCNLLKG
ncbi:MAG: NADH-quinone oxidoreductase subunit NuoK [Deltaproteobacteria bacterium]|nr:NADH-quinone oxidoreductase subunit NuoK [Deltaproteobacteria bacterium]